MSRFQTLVVLCFAALLCLGASASAAWRQQAKEKPKDAPTFDDHTATLTETKDGKETTYGMGWFIGKSKSGQRIYEHSGGSVGGSSELILYPDTHLVVAFVCNFSGGEDGWKGEEVQVLAEKFGEAAK